MFGKFVISLDFEMMWGMHDNSNSNSHHNNVYNCYKVVPKLLEVFTDYNISATWAIVGMLMPKNIKQLVDQSPSIIPSYQSERLSPYGKIDLLKEGLLDFKLYNASELVEQIRCCPNQEIGTHTFSHYYCNEKGQSVKQFEADLIAAHEANDFSSYKSIVFPRNQINDAYIMKCSEYKLESYRGLSNFKIKINNNYFTKIKLSRLLSLVNTYIKISKCSSYDLEIKHGLLNIKESLFLRPYSKKLSFLEPLKMRRIKKEMEYAAKEKKIFHLWWHPHNFGSNSDKNFLQLRELLEHFIILNGKYDMQSLNMADICENFNEN